MKSILMYPGSKWKLAPKIIAMIPPHNCFVDVFGGSAAVLLSKPPSAVEVYNDIDNNLVNFFKILRDDETRQCLMDALRLTPYSRTEFYEAHKIMTEDKDIADPIERARLTFVIYNQSISGMGISEGHGQPWKFGFRDSIPKKFHNTIDHLVKVAQRLSRVLIECNDWRRVFELYDNKDNVLYIDPPYPPDVRFPTFYTHELYLHDHKELVDKVMKLKSKTIISGYDQPIYNRLEGEGWERTEIKHTMTMAPNVKSDTRARMEIIWSSPGCLQIEKQGSLF